MTPQNLVQCPLERGYADRPFDVKRQIQHVTGAVGLQAAEEPQRLLIERQGSSPWRGIRGMRPSSAAPAACRAASMRPASVAIVRAFEHVAQRQRELPSHGGRQLVQQNRGLQRIAAKLEKVVVDADAIDVQNFRPQAGHRSLQLRPRRDKGRSQVGSQMDLRCRRRRRRRRRQSRSHQPFPRQPF